ncbi:anthranilate synthase component 1 [Pseudomonas aeruginosa]|uniref:anthranilate synthase component 1 n=1 Tax=Pseudomonas aeruginosa TaxID=287 RepID=UPI000D75081C|nr:anthranilate synthase component 1 [Pseudomonas aeruginosa]MBA4991514.1 anthranilate synthase component 1 [Pseudomonas aeruginosa]WCV80357.1 anthranilate synthase component 1 [Pseudomonas aeruginosa]HBO0857926.1 anthranilate synthase component 1 [Pseudomonas aeruginosa]HBO5213166.1 anthranilate synthase component 1 [Pseudomonas aeruginosa]HBP0508853.1 anthranilate synthase component 1 [Pseudomonas aeruginosa]
MGAGRWLVSGVGYRLEESLEYRTLVPEALSIWRMAGANRMLFDCFDVDSKAARRSVAILSSCLRIECWGRDVVLRALNSNGRALLAPLSEACPAQVTCLRDGDTLHWRFPPEEPHADEWRRLHGLSSLEALRRVLGTLGDAEGPALLGGLFSFDLAEQFEPLPAPAEPARHCPDYLFLVPELLLDIDHLARRTSLQAFVHDPAGHDRLAASLRQCADEFHGAVEEASESPVAGVRAGNYQVDLDDASFARQVERLQAHVRAGDVFQIVPSRSFSMPCADPWRAYRQLCLRNPSPYRFFLDAGDFCLFGASPESALKYDAESREVELYPIAGTRPRGRDAQGGIDAELDNRLEAELRLDAKEIAEHMMLVDLARNDLARVCRSGTRQVRDMLKVDRYSHVMHLVSRVAGELHGELDALHAYRACLNMGTLVGAPKVRAMQLLRQYEDGYRGSYGGAIGILDSAGNLDTSIVIRSAEVREGIARVRAGAGVVLDSDPRLEAEETRNKALAVLTAVAAAERERGERDAHHAVG